MTDSKPHNSMADADGESLERFAVRIVREIEAHDLGAWIHISSRAADAQMFLLPKWTYIAGSGSNLHNVGVLGLIDGSKGSIEKLRDSMTFARDLGKAAGRLERVMHKVFMLLDRAGDEPEIKAAIDRIAAESDDPAERDIHSLKNTLAEALTGFIQQQAQRVAASKGEAGQPDSQSEPASNGAPAVG